MKEDNCKKKEPQNIDLRLTKVEHDKIVKSCYYRLCILLRIFDVSETELLDTDYFPTKDIEYRYRQISYFRNDLATRNTKENAVMPFFDAFVTVLKGKTYFNQIENEKVQSFLQKQKNRFLEHSYDIVFEYDMFREFLIKFVTDASFLRKKEEKFEGIPRHCIETYYALRSNNVNMHIRALECVTDYTHLQMEALNPICIPAIISNDEFVEAFINNYEKESDKTFYIVLYSNWDRFFALWGSNKKMRDYAKIIFGMTDEQLDDELERVASCCTKTPSELISTSIKYHSILDFDREKKRIAETKLSQELFTIYSHADDDTCELLTYCEQNRDAICKLSEKQIAVLYYAACMLD